MADKISKLKLNTIYLLALLPRNSKVFFKAFQRWVFQVDIWSRIIPKELVFTTQVKLRRSPKNCFAQLLDSPAIPLWLLRMFSIEIIDLRAHQGCFQVLSTISTIVESIWKQNTSKVVLFLGIPSQLQLPQ